MKKLLFLALPLLMVHAAVADDQTRNVQTQLKNQGFYYGDVDGQASNETSSAIRRYQIRNGLEVTGAVNQETLHALGLGPGGTKSTAKTAPIQPQLQPRRSSDDSDRNFLRQEEQHASDRSAQESPSAPSSERQAVPPPPESPQDEPSPRDYAAFFARTPYFNAPRQVQQETLRRAQAYMAGRGFFREPVNGLPGPATEEALLSLQRFARLELTGRLDLDTLAYLRLLPGHGNFETNRPQLQPFYPNNAVRVYPPDYPPRRVYRGIQVD